MADRDPTEQVQLKIRLRGKLLARLEAEAKSAGYPLNAVITNHLEEGVRADALGIAVFGSAERFGILHTIDRLSLAIQLKTGKGWADDETRYLIADTVSSFIKHGAEIFATLMAGKSPSPEAARSVADAFALQATAQILHKHLERMTEDAPDAAPQAEGGRRHG